MERGSPPTTTPRRPITRAPGTGREGKFSTVFVFSPSGVRCLSAGTTSNVPPFSAAVGTDVGDGEENRFLHPPRAGLERGALS